MVNSLLPLHIMLSLLVNMLCLEQGNSGEQEHLVAVNSFCGWRCMIDVGKQLVGRGIICKTVMPVTSVISNLRRSPICCFHVSTLGKPGSWCFGDATFSSLLPNLHRRIFLSGGLIPVNRSQRNSEKVLTPL